MINLLYSKLASGFSIPESWRYYKVHSHVDLTDKEKALRNLLVPVSSPRDAACIICSHIAVAKATCVWEDIQAIDTANSYDPVPFCIEQSDTLKPVSGNTTCYCKVTLTRFNNVTQYTVEGGESGILAGTIKINDSFVLKDTMTEDGTKSFVASAPISTPVMDVERLKSLIRADKPGLFEDVDDASYAELIALACKAMVM